MNPQRGDVALEIEGEERRLCLTLGALAEIEAGLGCQSMKDLTARLKALSARDMMVVLAALLRGGGEDELAKRVAELALPPQAAYRAILACFGRAAE